MSSNGKISNVNPGFTDLEASYVYDKDGNRSLPKTKKRPIINRTYLEKNFTYNNIASANVIKSGQTYIKKYYKPSGDCLAGYFFKRFPFFKWIQDYDFKKDITKDLIAGLTLGVVQIPQGMAYSLMAGLPPMNGLYVSFILILQYVFFGTSKHISTGTYAIVSLMIGASIKNYEGVLYPRQSIKGQGNTTNSSSYAHQDISMYAGGSSDFISNNPQEAKIMIAGVLSLISGMLLVLFSIFHIGALTKYLSNPIINGFTTGAAYHVIVSQIPPLLGIKLGGLHIPFVITGELIEVVKEITEINWATFVISLISIVFIYLIKVQVNHRFQKQLPVPLPVELMAVALGTTISYLVEFNQKWNVEIVGDLKTGFPAPSLPNMNIFLKLIGDAVPISIVTFALNISVAKLYARKHKYDIKANQINKINLKKELFSYGTGNIICAFFSGFPGCVGLSRTVIMDDVGGRTQVNGFFSSALILLVILLLGPLFKSLPNCVLAAIIVVALKTMVLEVKEFPTLLRKSKIEALGWLVTFLGVMILNVDYGLYIGVASSIIIIILKSQRARVSLMGNIPGTSIFECIETCNQAQEFPGIKIIRYEESLYYANVDNFKYQMIKLSTINPNFIQTETEKLYASELKKLMKRYAEQKKMLKCRLDIAPSELEPYILDENGVIILDENQQNLMSQCRNKVLSEIDVKHVILDCSCMNYVDSQGVDTIKNLHESFSEAGVSLYLSYCKQQIIKSFRKFQLHEEFDFERILATTNEAIRFILTKDRSLTISVISDKINYYEVSKVNDESLEMKTKNFDKLTQF